MNNRRKCLVALVAGALAVPLGSFAQPAKGPRIGLLLSGSQTSDAQRADAFRSGLRDLGYVEGENIAIELRYAQGKAAALSPLAAELVGSNISIVVVAGSTAADAVRKASSAIPIVLAFSSDPVAARLVASLARPGGNITGLSLQAPELGGKQLEMLKEILPRLSRVAVIGYSEGPTYSARMKEIETAARTLRLQVQAVELRGRDDLDNAFLAISKGGAGAILGLQNPAFIALQERIAEFAARSRLPAMHIDSEFADAGGLLTYGPHYADLFRRAATYVDKILKGTKPGDIPVEQPTRFELVINMKTAKTLGITIPQSVLVRADRVIE